VFGHIPRRFSSEYSLTHGLNVVAHMEEFFFTTFEGPRDRDLDAMAPDWMPDYGRIDPILDLAAAHGVAIVPDLVASFTFQSLWADEDRAISTPDLAYFSLEDAKAWRSRNYSRRDRIELRMMRAQIKYPLIRVMTYRAQRRGILLLAGTDAPLPGVFPGRSLHEELRLLAAAGLTIYATEQTAALLKSHGIEAVRLHKVHEKKKPNILDYITERKIDFVISIPDPERKAAFDSDYALRRTAVDFYIPLLTNLQIAELFALALTTKKPADLHIKHWAEYE